MVGALLFAGLLSGSGHAAEPAPATVPDVSPVPASRSMVEAVQHTLREGLEWLTHANPMPMVLEQGEASYYANRFHGRKTASGERYDKNELTAAHKTLPFGTWVVVRSLETGREVAVRIIDRGPYLKDRVIDLSQAAAAALGIRGQGVSEVQIIEKPPANNSGLPIR
jgi:rare lipoprotein A